jgi:hypothetical protein
MNIQALSELTRLLLSSYPPEPEIWGTQRIRICSPEEVQQRNARMAKKRAHLHTRKKRAEPSGE